MLENQESRESYDSVRQRHQIRLNRKSISYRSGVLPDNVEVLGKAAGRGGDASNVQRHLVLVSTHIAAAHSVWSILPMRNAPGTQAGAAGGSKAANPHTQPAQAAKGRQ